MPERSTCYNTSIKNKSIKPGSNLWCLWGLDSEENKYGICQHPAKAEWADDSSCIKYTDDAIIVSYKSCACTYKYNSSFYPFH